MELLSVTAVPCRIASLSVGPLGHPPPSRQQLILTTSPTSVSPGGVKTEEGSASQGRRWSPLAQADLAADTGSVGEVCDRAGAELVTPGEG